MRIRCPVRWQPSFRNPWHLVTKAACGLRQRVPVVQHRPVHSSLALFAIPEFKSKLSDNLWKALEDRQKQYDNIITELSSTTDLTRVKELSSERSKLFPLMSAIDDLKNMQENFAQLRTEMNLDNADPEYHELIISELNDLYPEMEAAEDEILKSLLPEENIDKANVVLELRPAAGGLESSLFASEMLEVYQNYAERRGWVFDVISQAQTDVGGLREASVSIEGDGAFGYLKFESGVHRVQRVPDTEAAGRVHTSTITVAVLPEAATDIGFELKESDLRYDTMRASGAGGQHVNRTESAVRIVHIPTGITAASQADRSQHRNRELAKKVLISRLYEHYMKDINADRDDTRKSQIGTGERFERIRTYNYPQDRITDHRIGENFHGIDRLKSDPILEDIHESLVKFQMGEQLKQIIESFNRPENSQESAKRKK